MYPVNYLVVCKARDLNALGASGFKEPISHIRNDHPFILGFVSAERNAIEFFLEKAPSWWAAGFVFLDHGDGFLVAETVPFYLFYGN